MCNMFNYWLVLYCLEDCIKCEYVKVVYSYVIYENNRVVMVFLNCFDWKKRNVCLFFFVKIFIGCDLCCFVIK